MTGLKVIVSLFILIPFILAILSDEIEALERKISNMISVRKKKKRLLKEKKQASIETYDMAFIRKNAYEEVYRKCVEKTLDREMPYVSVKEIEDIIHDLKNRKDS